MDAVTAEATTFKRVGSTGLYEPVLPGKGEKLRFLLWNATSPPVEPELGTLWSQSRLPEHPGYFTFFNNLPTAGQSAAAEKELRKLLSPPTSSAFLWAKFDPKTEAVTVSTLLKTKLNAAKQTVVDGEVNLTVPAKMKTVVFPDGARLVNHLDEQGTLDGVVSTYPAEALAETPGGRGIELPLAGGISGKLVGCLRFQALVDALGGDRNADRVLKSLMDVAMDPLNPFDSSRNYQIFTDRNYILSGSDGNYRLTSAG